MKHTHTRNLEIDNFGVKHTLKLTGTPYSSNAFIQLKLEARIDRIHIFTFSKPNLNEQSNEFRTKHWISDQLTRDVIFWNSVYHWTYMHITQTCIPFVCMCHFFTKVNKKNENLVFVIEYDAKRLHFYVLTSQWKSTTKVNKMYCFFFLFLFSKYFGATKPCLADRDDGAAWSSDVLR